MKKWPEAIGLLDRALEHVTQSLEQYRSLDQGGGTTAVKVDKEKVCSNSDHSSNFLKCSGLGILKTKSQIT